MINDVDALEEHLGKFPKKQRIRIMGPCGNYFEVVSVFYDSEGGFVVLEYE